MAYLTDHPGALRQYSARTNWRPSRPTGLTNLHTTEFPRSWTVAQQAAWLRARTDPGCYHDIADTHGGDVWLVPYEMGAWQDGTGSNGMAMSIAFVCRTTDWRALTADERRRTLQAGARCFARQQAWLKANGLPLTELRYITKAQSDAGQSGFCCHGWRDPGRRTDPGINSPNLFPFDEWLEACRAATQEDDMYDENARKELLAPVHEMLGLLRGIHPAVSSLHIGVLDPTGGIRRMMADLAGRDIDIDEAQVAANLAPLLVPAVVAAVAEDVGGLSEEQLIRVSEKALRNVLGGLAGVTAA